MKKLVHIYIDQKSYDIDGILFDKDGTLLDFRSLWIDWSKDIIRHICAEVNMGNDGEKQLSDSIGMDWHTGDWDVKGPLAIGSMQELIIILAHQLYQSGIPWNTAFALIVNIFTKINEKDKGKNHIKAVPGLSNFLKKCQKLQLKLGVVTSDDHNHAVKHLKSLGIDSYFTAIIGGDQVSRGKPFPEAAEKASEKMELDLHRSIVFGDSDGDMILGNNIGAKASIGIIQESNETDHFVHADHLIHTYDTLTLEDMDKTSKSKKRNTRKI